MNKSLNLFALVLACSQLCFSQTPHTFYAADSAAIPLPHISAKYGFAEDRETNRSCALRVNKGKSQFDIFSYAMGGGEKDTFSYSFWFNIDPIGNESATLLGVSFPSPQSKALYHYYASLKQDTLVMGNQKVKIETEKWYHLVVTNRNSRRAIYLNTLLVSEDSIILGSLYYTFGELRAYFGSFQGMVDDFTIYDRFIDPAEIESLYSTRASCSTAILGLGEMETIDKHVTVYPNPSNGHIQIASAVPFQQVDVMSMQGNLIYSGSEKEINDLLPGMYFVKVYFGNEFVRRTIQVTE